MFFIDLIKFVVNSFQNLNVYKHRHNQGGGIRGAIPPPFESAQFHNNF